MGLRKKLGFVIDTSGFSLHGPDHTICVEVIKTIRHYNGIASAWGLAQSKRAFESGSVMIRVRSHEVNALETRLLEAGFPKERIRKLSKKEFLVMDVHEQ